MPILQIASYVSLAFVSYAVGRISHIYGGHLKAPHHWIYGLILMILGAAFHRHNLGKAVFYFGVGLFISDLEDFLQLKFFGVDEPGPKRFWGID